MKLLEHKAELLPSRQYLCITHSDRPASLAKCELNYLEMRFSRSGRLPPKEPFTSLLPSKAHSPYGGEITIHELGAGFAPRLVARVRPETYKPQHAIWYAGSLWVVGVEHVEVYDPGLRSVAKVQDPWLAGGHTLAPDGNGHILVSCAASDSILVIDATSFRVVQALRMPQELYGRNYDLRRTESVTDHYITNDLQITHVNCAAPWRDGILMSSLIPGAIGWFDRNGEYSELLRGFVGCHGVRAISADLIYFCDSCVGTLMILDGNMRLRQRVATGSRWLHDAVYISAEVFALAVYDSAEVWFMDVASRKVIYKLDCGAYGGPQFLAF